MATIISDNRDIFFMPQGFSLASAFSTDMSWAGILKQFDFAYSIKERKFEDHNIGSVDKIDNLYMMFVKQSSYDKPEISDIKKCLKKLAKKIKKNGVRCLAMPRICCGRNGYDWGQILPLIDKAFEDLDLLIVICNPDWATNKWGKIPE